MTTVEKPRVPTWREFLESKGLKHGSEVSGKLREGTVVRVLWVDDGYRTYFPIGSRAQIARVYRGSFNYYGITPLDTPYSYVEHQVFACCVEPWIDPDDTPDDNAPVTR